LRHALWQTCPHELADGSAPSVASAEAAGTSAAA
jgi:hypothetical protein